MGWYVVSICFGASSGIFLYDLLFRRQFDAKLNAAIKKAYQAGLKDGQALPTSWDGYLKRRSTDQ